MKLILFVSLLSVGAFANANSYNLEMNHYPTDTLKSDMVVNTGFFVKEDGSVCAIDTWGRSDLVPKFAKTAKIQQANIIEHNLPKCGPKEEAFIKENRNLLYLKDSYVEPVVAPAVGLVAPTLVGCGVGLFWGSFLTKEINPRNKWGVTIFSAGMGSLLGLLTSGFPLTFEKEIAMTSVAQNRLFISLFIKGIAGGTLGAIICQNGVAYIFETKDKTL